MMRSFELSHGRRVNVWLDQPLPANFTASSTVTRLMTSKIAFDARRCIAAIEINIPHGPISAYALLGGELVESGVNGLEVVVAVNSLGFPFRSSLAVVPEEVKVGLLDEYAGAVLRGVEKVGESRGLPTKASLRFRWAAHGLLGSSPSIFEKASGLVVQLLALPRKASEEDLMAVFG